MPGVWRIDVGGLGYLVRSHPLLLFLGFTAAGVLYVLGKRWAGVLVAGAAVALVLASTWWW